MKRLLFSETETRFLERIAPGKSFAETTGLFNRRFHRRLDVSRLREACRNRGIKNGMRGKNLFLFNKTQLSFLEKNLPGRSHEELTRLFNRRFRRRLRVTQIISACKNRGMVNGLDTRFKPGRVAPNKGKKGWCPPGSEKGWFKPGNKPQTYMPVGSRRVNADGYLEIKTADPDKWKPKHRIIWEKANGPVPGGHAVIFADKNRMNFKLKNLLLVSRSELAVMNRCGLIYNNAEFTKTGKLIAGVKLQIAGRKRRA